jgi:hypothetical protein
MLQKLGIMGDEAYTCAAICRKSEMCLSAARFSLGRSLQPSFIQTACSRKMQPQLRIIEMMGSMAGFVRNSFF